MAIQFEGWKHTFGQKMLIPADLVLHMQCKPLRFRPTITFLSVLDPEAQQQFGEKRQRKWQSGQEEDYFM